MKKFLNFKTICFIDMIMLQITMAVVIILKLTEVI